MKAEEKYEDLIVRYLDNSISESELRELITWIKESKDNYIFFSDIRDIWHSSRLATESEFNKDKALENFYSEIGGGKTIPVKRKSALTIIMNVAAVLLLSLLLTFLYNYFNKETKTEDIQEVTQVIIPPGHKGQVILPDGTKVWLNSNTTMKYNSRFNERLRKVFIDGEAFLNVAKDSTRPFQVETSDIMLQVLGTSFNVKSYSNDDDVETTLVEGSLKITASGKETGKFAAVTLKPNEKAIYFKNSENLVVTNLSESDQNSADIKKEKDKTSALVNEIEAVSAWKDDKLVFHNESFEDISVKMGRWYGMKITIVDESLKKERFTGKFVNNETVYQVLDIFNRSEPIQYTTGNKEIFISKRKSRL
jgi:transmembrane sensor